MAIPTPAEVGKVIRAADEPFAAFIAVCSFAGTRRGEASALKVSDVSFLRKELRVERLVQWTADGRMEIRPPKYGSERTIYIPDGLVKILAEYVRLYRPGDDPDRYLFPGSRDPNLPAHAATVSRSWRIVRDEVGIPYRLHDCRHYFASGLINAGCDVVTVQRHSDIPPPASRWTRTGICGRTPTTGPATQRARSLRSPWTCSGPTADRGPKTAC